MTYYKVLEKDGSAVHGTGKWTPGEWWSVRGELVPCKNGLHLCRREDLVAWLGPTIWTAEADDSEIIVTDNKVVVRRARIVDRIDTWDERTARLFAADCAEHVLPIYEAVYDDRRPHRAIEVARRRAEGEATPEELAAAYWAATAAVPSGPGAAHLAAGSAAYYVSAHWAAGSAAHWAYSAAHRAAGSAAYSAAAAAAADPAAERAWQTERLFAYLEGGGTA